MEVKNAVGYCRVSTKGQVGDDKYGLESQKADIRRYCEVHGYHVTRWYVDEGISGTEENRPELDKILYGDDVENPPIETVLVAKSDRIARDAKLYHYFLFVLEKKNIELISVSENFDQNGELSGIYRSLMLFVAEQERKNIAKRTSAGRRIKAKAGGYSGGRAPYGYRITDGQYAIVPEEAEMVKKIFAELDNKATLQDIADMLNEQGYRSRIGKRFQPSQIRAIRDNRPVYEGMYKYGANMVYVKGIHEPILK